MPRDRKPVSELTYRALHYRVRKYRGDPIGCTCGDPKGRFEWHCPKGLDPTDVHNYISVCQRCHKLTDLDDNARENLSKGAKRRETAGLRQRDERGRYV